MLPDFLCIGAPRAGTTWLYENLSTHPSIYIPEIKQVNYFGQKQLSMSGRIYKALNHQVKKFRYQQRKVFVENLVRKIKWKNIRFFSKFWLESRDDRWYESLFDPGEGKLSGDITPEYSALDFEQIKQLYQKMPKVKIIYLLRNPIYRTWSGAKYIVMKKGCSVHTCSDQEFIKIFTSPKAHMFIDYVEVYKNWKKFFPEKKIFIGFFDEIIEKPEKLLSRIYTFLDIEPVPLEGRLNGIENKINASPEREIPPTFKQLLAESFYRKIAEQADYFQSYAVCWENEARKILAK